ncbi:serine hydrolase domain-containing protein [Reichenbachiella ulvae]|uniref:Beta-lactamase family protein n=1 Tax=Reichenbachiella ulvae TaxID=2980104 RepID=A0ABT3CPI9_9BACT|nr:serine hydrolase domain-containing protein [Reichenbachiella ulvae]MCV9385559.1 beta-lactamase family protein [Reichenbachiella ulvae]
MMIKNGLLIPTMFLVFTLLSCENKVAKTDYVRDVLTSELDSLLSNDDINAVSIGVFYNGETYEFHQGELTKGLNDKPTEETIYEIASLTKTFTGTLLAQAIVDQKINLDDDIRIVLKDDFPNLEFENSPITFRHLVTHRSGIPNMLPNKPGIFKNPDRNQLPYVINELQKDFTRDAFFNELNKVKIDTVPGTKFSYSNAGANLLGYCLENIYNKRYEDLLKEVIFLPLKMQSTKITLTDDDTENLAQGYNENNIRMPFFTNKDMSAEGGIKSTLSDMMKYVAFQLDQDNVVVQKSHQELLGLWDDYDNGMFWQIFKNKNQPNKIFQNGGAFGTSSWLTIIPDEGIGVFVATNQSGPSIHGLLNNTVDSIIEKLATTK